MVVGLAALLLREVLPVERLSAWSERLVGLVLVAIGIVPLLVGSQDIETSPATESPVTESSVVDLAVVRDAAGRCRLGADGAEVVIRFLGPGEIFAAVAALESEMRLPVTAVALSGSAVARTAFLAGEPSSNRNTAF